MDVLVVYRLLQEVHCEGSTVLAAEIAIQERCRFKMEEYTSRNPLDLDTTL
jgi:hypothetical protein